MQSGPAIQGGWVVCRTSYGYTTRTYLVFVRYCNERDWTPDQDACQGSGGGMAYRAGGFGTRHRRELSRVLPVRRHWPTYFTVVDVFGWQQASCRRQRWRRWITARTIASGACIKTRRRDRPSDVFAFCAVTAVRVIAAAHHACQSLNRRRRDGVSD